MGLGCAGLRGIMEGEGCGMWEAGGEVMPKLGWPGCGLAGV